MKSKIYLQEQDRLCLRSNTLLILLAGSILITITNQTCTVSDEFCLSCETNSKNCTLCANSYLSATKTCTETTLYVDYCFSYKENGKCSICQYGYYLSDAATCLEIPINNCIVYDSLKNECIACKDSKMVDSKGTCDTTTECESSNCRYCRKSGSVTHCLECNGGYTILKNNDIQSCIQETKSVENCSEIYENNMLKCQTCDPPYYNLQGSCLKSSLYNFTKKTFLVGCKIILSLMVLKFND